MVDLGAIYPISAIVNIVHLEHIYSYNIGIMPYLCLQTVGTSSPAHILSVAMSKTAPQTLTRLENST
jgi:hypothetical protein